MKLKVLKTEIKRSKNITTCFLTVALNDNGETSGCTMKTFVASAYCHDEPYDFKTGKRIALARAEIKAYKYYRKCLKEAYNISKKLYEDSFELYNKLEKQIIHNRVYLKDIVSGSNN